LTHWIYSYGNNPINGNAIVGTVALAWNRKKLA